MLQIQRPSKSLQQINIEMQKYKTNTILKFQKTRKKTHCLETKIHNLDTKNQSRLRTTICKEKNEVI